MLWSLLLYLVTMVAINWDEINNTLSGKNKTTIVNNILQDLQSPAVNNPPANISHHADVFKKVMTVLSSIVKTSVN